MATTSPIRIDDEIHASAKLVAPIQSRSTAQQITHWARIGRELESGSSVSHAAVADVLAGRQNYDDLGAKEQAVVRAEWSERIALQRSALDLADEYTAQGRSWVELDDEGNVVRHSPDGESSD